MPGFDNLAREYEARRFGPTRQLDVHAEGPAVARARALHWIQSFAHEAPGTELLIVVERGSRPGKRPSPVRTSVETLLTSLAGRLIDGWSPFTSGSVVLRVSDDPRMHRPASESRDESQGDPDGRTAETAGAALPLPEADIPPPLLDLARRVAELRRQREALSLGLMEVVLRRVWIDAQARAMNDRLPFEQALEQLLQHEQNLAILED
jgi:hypothetical protein